MACATKIGLTLTTSKMVNSQKTTRKIRAIDLFSGAGGSSWGARNAGVEIVAAFDMWELAGSVYQDNFPGTMFYPGNLERVSARSVAQGLGNIDLILASPECTNHSVAKGKHKRSEESRRTAFHVVKFARVLQPRWIIIENVGSMRHWKGYKLFLKKLGGLGYHIREQILDASKFGVPQARKRLFILCDLEQKPPKVVPPPQVRTRSAIDIVDLNGTYRVSLLKMPKRAKATLQRAKRAIKVIGTKKPFLLVYYGTDKGGGWQRINRPLRTVTTVDRFALVKPRKAGPVMRMLQVPELQAAMGFPQRFELNHGNRREKIHLLGNAVCPPVMEAAVRTLIRNR
jgi:DNA (cytosine-5)-methyltransferase 1